MASIWGDEGQVCELDVARLMVLTLSFSIYQDLSDKRRHMDSDLALEAHHSS